jgi:PAS domain S-box-containing protein
MLANPTLVQMLGFDSLEDLKKRNISEEGYALDYQRKTFQDTIEKQGYVHGLEYAWKRKDGTNIFIRESSRLIRDENGKSLYYEGTVEDITESKHAEQLQKVLFNISNAAISTNNLKELIETIKQQLSTLLDTSNFYVAFYDETTGMFSSPYYSDEKDAIETWPAEKSLTGCIIKYNKPMLITDKEYLEMNKKGEVNLIGEPSKIWLGVPLRVEGKAIGAFVVQSYDDVNAYSEKDKNTLEFVSHQISIAIQRTKAMQDLKAALAKAEESDRLKSAFLANMSHEIRTPMNGILGFADLLNDDSIPPDEKRRFINIIKNNGQHLLSIINDIIDISKIDSNQLKITNVNFNLNHLLDELFIAYQNEIVQKGKTEITLQLDKTLPDAQSQIISDNIRLRQILFNLISNSLKFTKSGFIRFGYSLSENNLQFFVSDTGKGIAKDKQSIIFERFRQEEETHTRQFGGTGLGLSISKALIELMGGKIWLTSEEREGSAFYFTIPYTPFVAQPEPSREKSHQKNDFDFSDKTILVADDVPVNLDLVKVYLKKTQASLLFANDGKEALEICKNNPAVDLVLMDIQMPVMNGYEATREIRKLNKDLPVIAFTAYVFANDKVQCLEAGCNDFIPKPMDKNLLLKMLSKYL